MPLKYLMLSKPINHNEIYILMYILHATVVTLYYDPPPVIGQAKEAIILAHMVDIALETRIFFLSFFTGNITEKVISLTFAEKL